jgi:hypothetical protein
VLKRRVLVYGLLVLVLILALAMVIAPVAFAATGDDTGPPVSIEANQLWAMLVSVAVPFVTGLLVRRSWAKWQKALIAFALAGLVGVVTTYVSGNWSGDVWVIVLACFGAAQTTFYLVVDRVPGLKQWLYEQFGGAAPPTVQRK